MAVRYFFTNLHVHYPIGLILIILFASLLNIPSQIIMLTHILIYFWQFRVRAFNVVSPFTTSLQSDDNTFVCDCSGKNAIKLKKS